MLSERQVYLCVYNQTFLPIWTFLLGMLLPAQLRFADKVGTPGDSTGDTGHTPKH